MAGVTSLLGMVDPGELVRSFGIDWHLLVIQSLNFILVAYLLYRFGFKNVVRVMDERRQKIESGLEYAESMKKEISAFEDSKSKRMAEVKQEAENIVESAKKDAKSILEQGKEETRRLTESMVLNAEKEMENCREKILRDTKAEIGGLVADVARSVLSSKMTAEERNEYIFSAEKALLSENLG